MKSARSTIAFVSLFLTLFVGSALAGGPSGTPDKTVSTSRATAATTIVTDAEASAAAARLEQAESVSYPATPILEASGPGMVLFISMVAGGLLLAAGILLWHRLGFINRMPVQAKLYVGMAMLLTLTLAIGFEGKLFAKAGRLELAIEQAAKDNYKFRNEILVDLANADSIAAEHDLRISEAQIILAELVELESDPNALQLLEEFSDLADVYAGAFAEMSERYHEITSVRGEINDLAKELLAKLESEIAREQAAHDEFVASGSGPEKVLEYAEFVAALEHVEIAWLRAVNELSNYLLDHDEAHIRQMEGFLAKLHLSMAHAREVASSFDESHNTGAALAALDLAKQDAERIREIAGIIYKDQAEIDALSLESSAAIKKLEDDGLAVLDFANDRAQSTEVAASRISTLMLLGTVLAGGLIGFVLSDSIIRPVRTLTQRLAQLADGDFTVRIEVDRTDEFGRLGTAYNTASQKLGTMIFEVTGAAHEVAGAATEISATSEQMTLGMQSQTQQTSESSAAIDAMNTSLGSVAERSSEAAWSAANAGTEAEQGGEIVTQTVEEMRGIAEQVRTSVRAVDGLGGKSEQIGEIISVINDIADQTNLLALNAAIEAARAGEHGRGFAVVADEVRKLAERTTNATEQVSTSIREIQDDTKSAIAIIEQGSERVEIGVQRATEAGGSLERIVEASRSLRTMVEDIAHAIDDQKVGAQQVAEANKTIVEVTNDSSTAVAEANTAASNLSQQAERLLSMTTQFRV